MFKYQTSEFLNDAPGHTLSGGCVMLDFLYWSHVQQLATVSWRCSCSTPDFFQLDCFIGKKHSSIVPCIDCCLLLKAQQGVSLLLTSFCYKMYLFYCLPLQMFEHFLKSALNMRCCQLGWKGKTHIADTVNDPFCCLLNGTADKGDCFDPCSCADAP